MKRVQTETDWLKDLQELVSNPLPLDQLKERWFAAIIGDTPSKYAKSPVVWNAGFKALEIEALFVPLDVAPDRLAQVVEHLRQGERVLGFSVTVPYKAQVLSDLDELDPLAARIGAVNTVKRFSSGRLLGTNTDAIGAVQALTEKILPGVEPPLSSLKEKNVLLIGAGGAAQAVACALWERMEGGALTLVNRTLAPARALEGRLQQFRRGRVEVLEEAALGRAASKADLIVNASTKGQAGLGSLEAYSALAPAHPAPLGSSQEKWFRGSWEDIEENQRQSLKICASVPASTVFFDLVYAPLETPFLRHARFSGHPTANGKGMNIAQAMEAFFHQACRGLLEENGLYTPATQQKLLQAMVEVW